MVKDTSQIMVAIHMVTYNHEDYIIKAIESVMMQETTFNYRLFIGEDYSTDKTLEYCKILKDKYPNKIILIENKFNYGSKKNGIQIYKQCIESGAKYIALLEGDDYWTDTLKLQKQVDQLESNETLTFSMTRFLALTTDNQSKDENARFFKDASDIVYDFNMFTKGWYGGTLTLMLRTSAINQSIFYEYKYFRDVHLYTELLKIGNGLIQNFVSATYRLHNQGQHNSLSKQQQMLTAINCYRELYSKNPRIDALKVKYRYFVQQYIELFINNKSYLKVLIKTVDFGFKLNDSALISKMLKKSIKSTRIYSKFRLYFKKKNRVKEFGGSEKYWEKRYQANKNSGAGSYGRLAEFKAEVLNDFVKEYNITSVIEYGSGDGNQLGLANYPKYIGFDVSNTALGICREKFKEDKTKSFYNSFNETYKNEKADLTLSLDVIYHLIENEVFEVYMNRLFNSSNKFVIIYSSNYNERSAAHVRSRKFTDWIEAHRSQYWELMQVLKNKYPFDINDSNNTSMADFYIYKKKMI